MRVLFLPDLWTVLLCFVIWPLLQASISWICLKIPDRHYHPENFWFRTHGWEKDGSFYQQVFWVRKWKEWLPDGGKAFKNGYQKKRMKDWSSPNLEKFLVESCRAEAAHWIAILPFWIFGLIGPAVLIPIMFFYAIVVNGPCIIAQRFNRPRIRRMLLRANEGSPSK